MYVPVLLAVRKSVVLLTLPHTNFSLYLYVVSYTVHLTDGAFPRVVLAADDIVDAFAFQIAYSVVFDAAGLSPALYLTVVVFADVPQPIKVNPARVALGSAAEDVLTLEVQTAYSVAAAFAV